MEECIYNLIPREEVKTDKQQKYTSKFKSSVRDEVKTNKTEYKTMGQAKVPTRPPDMFLKKREGEPQLPDKRKYTYPDNDSRKPNVPKKEDQPVMGLRTTKNFINQNAVENIMSVPRKPGKNYVDTKCGDKQPLEPSGMEPKYINKKEYGKNPSYLVKRKEEIIHAQEEYDAYVAEHMRRGAMKALTVDERDEILSGLKQNWELIHHEYQGLSVVTDTAPKKNRKERMEAEMKQLERDIETVERHRCIYVSN